MTDSRPEPDNLSAVDAAQVLRAICAEGEGVDAVDALRWRAAVVVLPVLLDAVDDVLAESVCP